MGPVRSDGGSRDGKNWPDSGLIQEGKPSGSVNGLGVRGRQNLRAPGELYPQRQDLGICLYSKEFLQTPHQTLLPPLQLPFRGTRQSFRRLHCHTWQLVRWVKGSGHQHSRQACSKYVTFSLAMKLTKYGAHGRF